MERLTERWSDSVVKLKGCNNVYANVERKRAHIQNAIVRLAAYEDSGLMPDEVKELSSITRCKDCRSAVRSSEREMYCKRYNWHMKKTDFCSYGKKVEE